MKRIVLLITIISIFYGCGDDEKNIDTVSNLVFSTDTMIFTDNQVQTLYISTKPGYSCDYQIISSPQWLTVYQKSGHIQGNIAQVAMLGIIDSFGPGIHYDKLEFMTTLGNKIITLKVVSSEKNFYQLPDSLLIDTFTDKDTIWIKNKGNVALPVSLLSSTDYINITGSPLNIPNGESAYLLVNVDKSNLTSGKHYSDIILQLKDLTDTVHVCVNVYASSKQMLTSDVIDAEYCKATDKMIFVSSSPIQLHIFDAATSTIDHIALNYYPTCVSVSADGKTAVVGHDAHISYVDLVNKSIIRVFGVSVKIGDIVLSNNKWAYLIPESNSYEPLMNVNLNLNYDNETSTGYNNYYGAAARMHPSGKYIYISDNYDFDKFNIQSGVAVFMYGVYTSYSVYDNFWFTEEGDRIITRGKSVAKTSELQSQDLIYNGSITLPQSSYYIEWADHSSATQNLFILHSASYYDGMNSSEVMLFNSTNLVFKQTIPLEKYMVPNGFGGGTFYEAEPFYVFAHSSGNKIFVLTKAYKSGLVNEWAIQHFNIDK